MPTVRRKAYKKTIKNRKTGSKRKVNVKATVYHRTSTPHYRKPKR